MEEPQRANPVDRWIEPFFSESMLWPVGIVLLLSFVSFGAAALTLAIRARSWPALIAIAAAGIVSVEVLWRDLRRGRFGRTSGLIVALWLLSLGLAGVAVWAGIA